MAKTSNNVNVRVAHTITATNCRIVVTYHSPRTTRPGQRLLVHRANGPHVRATPVSLTSLTSITTFTRRLLGQKRPLTLLVGGTKAVRARHHVARSKLRQAIDIGCMKPCLLAHGLLPLVKRKDHVIGVMSYACTVNRLSFPSFFLQKEEKSF